jgi:hypothetical protein
MCVKMRGIGVLLFMFLVVSVFGAAAEQPAGTTPLQNTQVDQANKYLSAEVARQMKDSKDEMLQEMKAYQDENFRIFDGRMQSLMDDSFQKVILGGIGAMLLAAGFVAYILTRYFKTYSYETYQQKLIGKQQEELEAKGLELQAMRGMQESTWNVQPPSQTIGMQMGQAWASEATGMNQWQAQPAYDGAWRAPIETQPEFTSTGSDRRQSAEYDDPMGMPEWLRRDNDG